jgi:hypothetical protein
MRNKIEKSKSIVRSHNLALLVSIICIAVSFLGSTVGGSVLFNWKDESGQPLPFQSQEEVEDFLRTAEIVKVEGIKEGTTKPRRVILERDGVRMKACFRDVHVYKKMERLESGAIKYDFRDEAVYEIAAYEFGKLLGLKNIPPTVLREVKGKKGTLQAWVEGCMMEKDRQKKNIQPPRTWNWVMQNQIMQLFDQLIWNDDRNLGNVLIDSDWKLWLIDHTRSFRTYKQLQGEESIKFCEKNVWVRLKNLDRNVVEEELAPYLNSGQIKSLMKRQELLVEYIQGIIDERGEKKVLFSYPAAVEKAPVDAQASLSISLQADPSEDCFPASSLQISELREDFSRVCRNCELVSRDDTSAEFTVIVADPGFNWNVLILGRDGALLEEFEWTGSLTTGLKKAVRVLHEQQDENRGSEGVTLASAF